MSNDERTEWELQHVVNQLDVINERTERMERQNSRIEVYTSKIDLATSVLQEIKQALISLNKSLVTVLLIMSFGIVVAFVMAMRAATNTNAVVEVLGSKATIVSSPK